MRIIALTILLMAAGSLTAGTTLYRWVDEHGRVHYSDQPQPTAEQIEVGEPTTFSSSEANRVGDRGALTQRSRDDEPAPTQDNLRGYDNVTVTAPTQDQVLWNLGSILTVNIGVQPNLQPGHKIRVTYDGRTVEEWPATATSHQIRDVYRGTHTVAVSIVDASGRQVAAGDPVTFYVKQTSTLN